uniref:Acid phosphatase n=1 Tax=Medicago truncatula TaxID=3880 RepID=B7FK35_MEDTR|nr:unknown [Medicago truncatula]
MLVTICLVTNIELTLNLLTVKVFFYARTLNLKDGRDLWVFDIDETTLSNLPYYATHGFGVNPYNETLFNAWVDEGAAPALPETQKLYNKLVNLGVKIAFLTGRPLKQKDITAKNLKEAGYHTYEKLILKDTELYHGKTAVQYKSSERKKLEEEDGELLETVETNGVIFLEPTLVKGLSSSLILFTTLLD